jgi:hypothetical protein
MENHASPRSPDSSEVPLSHHQQQVTEARKRTTGYVTLAHGKDFAEMAIDLALSVKEHCSEPISVVCDKSAERQLSRYRETPFHHILPLETNIHPWGAKLAAALKSPYTKSIFVDADVLFLKPVTWFQHFSPPPLAMYGAYMPKGTTFQTYYTSEQIFRDFRIERYFWATSGVFQFYRPEAEDFFKQCLEFYTCGIRKYKGYTTVGLADELVIGIVAAHHNIHSIHCPTVHPWPMADDLMSLEWETLEQPLIHVFGKINDTFFARLLGEVKRRRQNFGLPISSERAWRKKASGTPSFSEKLRHLLRTRILSHLPNWKANVKHEN